jgi:hypothetical protein
MKDSACVADNAVPLTDICRMAAGRTEKHAPIWGFQQVGAFPVIFDHQSVEVVMRRVVATIPDCRRCDIVAEFGAASWQGFSDESG